VVETRGAAQALSARRFKSSPVVLTGRLSDHDLTPLQRLMARDWKQADRRHRPTSGVASDGRRRYGTVRDAIVAVLEQAGCELRVRDIHEGVEKGLVSLSRALR
jgi:hypothetical protein